tara:strand:+ start:178 stop:696 length:519 start_codon:yes stop_codon:yes gene_type:complete
MSRTLTINKSKKYPSLEPGWKEVEVSGAKYDDYNGNRYIDVNFAGYPESLRLRVYESVNKKTGEEWRIGQLFRFANAGISGGLDGANGSVVMKIDDAAQNLIHSKLNVYFYKKGDYTEVYRDFAPTVFKNDVEEFSNNDIDYWKGRAEKNFAEYGGGNAQTTTEDDSFDDPF